MLIYLETIFTDDIVVVEPLKNGVQKLVWMLQSGAAEQRVGTRPNSNQIRSRWPRLCFCPETNNLLLLEFNLMLI